MTSLSGHYDPIQVRWRGEVVGTLSEGVPDMWYVDGVWTPADTPLASQFAAKAKVLDPKVVWRDSTKGIRIELGEGGVLGDALAVSLANGRLLVRRVIAEAAVAWLRANVPE